MGYANVALPISIVEIWETQSLAKTVLNQFKLSPSHDYENKTPVEKYS